MPYWRLSNYYFFYFASLGALLPYWGLYLNSLGYSPIRIGELMALVMGTKIISPVIWGWIADHTGQRMKIVRLGSLLSIVCFFGVFISTDYAWMAAVLVSFSFFWNATLPQFEATTFSHLKELHQQYSRIRLWGSVGFIVAVASLGLWFEHNDIASLPIILALIFIAIWFASLVVPEKSAGHLSLDHEPLLNIILQRRVAGLLIACLLMQASHGAYYTFYSLYLEQHGYTRSLIGGLWALGVLAEVFVFIIMHRMIQSYGLVSLLLFSLLLASLRWLLIGLYPSQMGVMLFAQLLHAASFGIYHASAIALIHHYFPSHHQGKGQALYSSISFGLGGAIGTYLSGVMWETVDPASVFYMSAVMGLLGALMFIFLHGYVKPFTTKVQQ